MYFNLIFPPKTSLFLSPFVLLSGAKGKIKERGKRERKNREKKEWEGGSLHGKAL